MRAADIDLPYDTDTTRERHVISCWGHKVRARTRISRNIALHVCSKFMWQHVCASNTASQGTSTHLVGWKVCFWEDCRALVWAADAADANRQGSHVQPWGTVPNLPPSRPFSSPPRPATLVLNAGALERAGAERRPRHRHNDLPTSLSFVMIRVGSRGAPSWCELPFPRAPPSRHCPHPGLRVMMRGSSENVSSSLLQCSHILSFLS